MHHHFGNLCVVEGVQCNEMHEEQEAGSRAYMMNEKSKSLGKPGVKSGGAKKISLTWLRWENGVGFIFFSLGRCLGLLAKA